MYYVYIIFSKKLKKKYIGSTSNLKTRLHKHNSRKSKFTSRGVPWCLLYYEAFLNKSDAIREELFLKSGRGRDRLNYLFRKN